MSKPRPKNISGRRIQEARLFRIPPLSQIDLARLASRNGVRLDQSTISRIESRTRNVSDYELAAIARALRVSMDALCGRIRNE